MINIIIVDDSKGNIEELKKELSIYDDIHVLKVFDSPITAEEEIKIMVPIPDALFLDIEMPEINGTVLAKKLKNVCHNIIYISSYMDNHYQETLQSVIKPIYVIKRLTLKTDLEIAIRELRKKFLRVKSMILYANKSINFYFNYSENPLLINFKKENFGTISKFVVLKLVGHKIDKLGFSQRDRAPVLPNVSQNILHVIDNINEEQSEIIFEKETLFSTYKSDKNIFYFLNVPEVHLEFIYNQDFLKEWWKKNATIPILEIYAKDQKIMHSVEWLIENYDSCLY